MEKKEKKNRIEGRVDGKLNNLSFKRYIRFVTSRTVPSTNEDLLTDDEMAREKERFLYHFLFFSLRQAMTSKEIFCIAGICIAY